MKIRIAWLLLLACAPLRAGENGSVQQPAWPALTQWAKPWIRWWWPGSAVKPAELTRHLAAFAAAGIGGVEITPIYGARGAESKYIDYLSPQWVDMLAHTAREARQLGLGVDMATGTGWPFGGPAVQPADASSSLQFVDGRLMGKPTDMKVKRPAPGGEGLVLDPYSTTAMEHYLDRFNQALSPLPRGALRSQFHDSFEYFNASWSADLPAAFRALNGYDLEDFAAELAGGKPLDADTLGRIKGDYRRTLAQMHLNYLRRWVDWSHARGMLARNQAHGAPANLLDLYAAPDIPETESFGATRMAIAGLRQDAADINEDPDPAIGLVARFASSAAHVMRRPLVSSETLTWLRENFRESPAAAKPQLDRLFVAGINHVFYHGTTYSPAEAAWPGWFFYAATQLNPANPLWQDYSAMHAYVARVQSVLQAGKPDNNVLFYWPQADLDDDPAGLMRQYGMHDNAWSRDSHAGRLARQLLEAGYAFDFISDAQLQQLGVKRQKPVTAAGAGYDLIVVPKTRRMPGATLLALRELIRKGVRVAFEDWPEDVPGYGNLEKRRPVFRALLAQLEERKLALYPALVEQLDSLGGRREALAQSGLWFTRRQRADGHDYFLVNPGAQRFSGWVTLRARGAHALLLNPLNGEAGLAAVKQAAGQLSIYLQLDSGQSLIVRTYRDQPQASPWPYTDRAAAGMELVGPWHVDFTRGGPELPAPVALDRLASWTALADRRGVAFSGTARYRIEFTAPAGRADDWLLDLGDVRESARVTLNGRFLGTVWSLPASIALGGALAQGSNLLEIEVTNLPANRIRDLDQRKVEWKIMKDINLASLRYRALDAATWEPAPSGLLGPVRLVPLRLVSPWPSAP